jgi:hypothetical protein
MGIHGTTSMERGKLSAKGTLRIAMRLHGPPAGRCGSLQATHGAECPSPRRQRRNFLPSPWKPMAKEGGDPRNVAVMRQYLHVVCGVFTKH